MSETVKDLTVEELQKIIENTVREILEDYMEDIIALSSEKYLSSIEEARKEYRNGKIKKFEEIFNV
ncbi:hypothetical protein [Thermodesulfovibrio sp. TK110]